MSNEFVVIQNKTGEEYAVREQDFERNQDGQYDGFKVLGYEGKYANLEPYEHKTARKAEEPAKK